ncbi:hypothetical protein ANCCAN_12669 [Ancylostoma caninum]|uniref:Uncharacterized protein n=1 Tax=Ancylostoma caninum TaxID=29170 RepID=A0A368GCB5_ANCCA|nr:hypothetical protein ANCCAN_12669 [Ancylostoma caninum]
MAPTAEHEGKFYPTRFRERMAIQKKYDDISSCVVEKALMVTSDRPATPSLSKSKLRKRAWSESLPAKARIRFDSERINRESSSSEDSEQTSSAELEFATFIRKILRNILGFIIRIELVVEL